MAKKAKTIKELLVEKVVELAPGITNEKISPLFFDITKLRFPPEQLYRLDSGNHRYYYKMDAEGEPIFYTSVTTLIKNTLPTPPSLIKWIADRGQEDSQSEALERANYGKFLHLCCAELMMKGKFDLEKLQNKLTAYILQNEIVQTKGWLEDLKKDILAFAQFIIDYNVKPLAIEICLYHPEDGYAGAIDLVCEMDWKKARIRAIIDLKSGRKGFYESNEIQLQAYANMWQIHFQETLDKVFNWSPKDWRKSPTYNLKDQTDSPNAKKLPMLVELAKIENDKRENKVMIIGGNIDLLSGLEKNINEYTFTELIKKQKL
jgi:hypothetical protein